MRRMLLFAALCLYSSSMLAQCPTPGPTNWCSGTYIYDGMGNIRAIGSDIYIYDTAGRLLSGTAEKQRGGASRQDYGYDTFGNRTSASRIAGSVDCLGGCEQSPTIDPVTNHITSNGAAYDVAGNLTSITNTVGNTSFTSTYDYDALGSMTRASAGSDVRQFIYTADGERIATRNGQNWTWTIRGLDGKVLREFTSTEPNLSPGLPANPPQWAKDYIWRDGLLLASVTAASGTTITQHYHLDHLGTPRVISNDAGVQTSIHAYYPFGAELNLGTEPSPGELMKFTGHERDLLASNPNALDYMHARFEMGTMGRFLSVDPIDGLQSFPQSWNRYAYARNNPLKYLDPTGQYVFAACSGSTDQCQADQTAFEQARQNDLGSRDAAVHNAAAAYGDPGQQNGVTVAFGTPAKGSAGETSAFGQGHEDRTVTLSASVLIQTGLRGPALKAVVGHEGQHVFDAQGFIASFGTDPSKQYGLTWDISKNLTNLQTETNAYHITQSILASSRQSASFGCQACVLGSAARTPADVDLAITRILTNPTGPYAATNNNRQVTGWDTPPQAATPNP